MSEGQLGPVIRQIRHLAAPAPDNCSDAQLLQRFARDRDEAAFEALVRRHGSLVWGVCRRVLRHTQDAEDAFQATFLTLTRKPSSIRRGDSVASWLFGVARRVARRAADLRSRARIREAPPRPSDTDNPPAEAALRELQAILQEEVAGLPEKLRAPFVLCCLEGKAKAEAARDLGWKEGTVSGRLAEARQRLRRRLARRGVVLSAALAASALGREALAHVPHALAGATTRAALLFVAGATNPTVLSP